MQDTQDAQARTPWDRLGLAIGHATDDDGGTGCTVVRGVDGPFRCAAALIGRASGSRELATCEPDHLVDRTDAVLLTGGSAYGLDATAGAMRWMEERGRGLPVGNGVVPIVPAAVLFDLAPLGRFDARPTPELAYLACSTASSRHIAEGSVGAGTGALVGKAVGAAQAMKGGVGLGVAGLPADRRDDADGNATPPFAAAIAVVNAFGDVRDGTGRILAGARAASGGFVDAERLLRHGQGDAALAAVVGGRRNTTLAVVAVSLPMDKGELAQLARAATAAFHRRITPCGTLFDGDVLFAVSPLPTAGAMPWPDDATARAALRSRLEALATAALEQAIERGVRTARGREGIPGLADFAPDAGRRIGG
jgi:L-aminopeptidase/D-esterase-like protein